MKGTRWMGGKARVRGIAVTLTLLAAAGTFWVFTSRGGAFDAELWQAQRGKSERDNPRVGMAVELQQEHLRVGMSRTEVQRLLGEPEQRQGLSDVYELGASPVGGDYEYFVVDYDSAGKVTQWRITRG